MGAEGLLFQGYMVCSRAEHTFSACCASVEPCSANPPESAVFHCFAYWGPCSWPVLKKRKVSMVVRLKTRPQFSVICDVP